MKDNGKIRLDSREGIAHIEIYQSGEIQLHDVVWIDQTLRWLNQQLTAGVELPLFLPEEIIIDGTGSYSLSENAYLYLGEMMSDCKMVAFVIHSYPQEVIADLFKSSYLLHLNVKSFDTVTEAVKWIQLVPGQQQSSPVGVLG